MSESDTALGQITSEEIASQPECWTRALAQARAGVPGLPLAGERVLVLGCGTSYYVACAYAWLREQAGHGLTDAMIASELPKRPREYDRVVAISRSGTTTEVLRAMRRFTGAVPVTGLVGGPGTPVAEQATDIVDLSYADEHSVVQTRFPTTLLTLLRAALGEDERTLADLVRAGEAATRAGLAVEPPRQLVVLASGWAAGLAQEAALKCREAAGMWAEAYATGEYRHGPISVAGPGTLVWAMTPLSDTETEAIEATGADIRAGGSEPLAELVLLQRLAVAWAAAGGRDADRPVHLSRSVITV